MFVVVGNARDLISKGAVDEPKKSNWVILEEPSKLFSVLQNDNLPLIHHRYKCICDLYERLDVCMHAMAVAILTGESFTWKTALQINDQIA